MAGNASLKDIAKLCNLSQSSVTYIMNGNTRYKFKPETVQLVKETARKLNYRPNIAASNLRKGKNNVIIGVLGNAARYLDIALAGRLKAELGKLHYNLMLQFMTAGTGERERVEFFREIHSWGAGLAIWSTGIVENSPYRAEMVDLINSSPPTVSLMAGVPESRADYVDMQWHEYYHRIGNYFKSHGCRSVGMVISGQEFVATAIGEEFKNRNRSLGMTIRVFAPDNDDEDFFNAGRCVGKFFAEHPDEIPDGLYFSSDEALLAALEIIDLRARSVIVSGGDTEMNRFLAEPIPCFGASFDWVVPVAADLVRRIESGDWQCGSGRCVVKIERDIYFPPPSAVSDAPPVRCGV